MKKEVTVNIETKSKPKDDAPRLVSVCAKATLFMKDELAVILYREDKEEFGDTTTTIKIKPGRAEIVRSGDINSTLIFDMTHTFEGIYKTPYGNLPVKTTLTDMETDLCQSHGSVSMNYTLDFAGEITENKFTLKYN